MGPYVVISLHIPTLCLLGLVNSNRAHIFVLLELLDRFLHLR